MNDVKESSGVQQLIDKLKNKGVYEGQKLAEALINEAEAKAARILSTAQAEADKLFADTRHKLEIERTSFHEAIKTAFRDTQLALRAKIREAFAAHLKRLVSLEVADKDFIKQLVLAIGSLNRDEISKATNIEVLVPLKLFEKDETGMHLTHAGKIGMRHLVLGLSQDMLREGIELQSSTDVRGGIKVRLIGNDVELDLSDEAISDLLLKFLLPRYREIVSGQEYT
jgi:V/A-type H+-transporting ATPase subunit E